MNLLKCILTNNPCYKVKQTIKPKGVMVHSTGANNKYIKRYVQPMEFDVPSAYDPNRETLLKLLGVNPNHNDWNHTTREVGVHAFIGALADGSVATAQALPWNHRGWHAGVGYTGYSANNTHISFEICEDDLTDPDYFEKAKNEAVELTAMLCELYDLDPLAPGVVICHQDGYRLGIACNHGDIYNWWPRYNYTMDDFRYEVLRKMNEEEGTDDMVYYETRDEVPEYYQPTIDKLVADGDLKGTAENCLHVSDDFCRIMTVLDRRGLL